MPFLRKYNTAITAGTAQSIKIPLIKRGVVDFAVSADWTPAAGDVKVSKDGGAAASIATLPAAVTMGNTAYWEFVFSGAELSCGTLVVTVADSATKAVEDQAFIIETYGNASALYQWDMSLANVPANVTQLLGTAWLTPAVAGTPDANAKQIGGQAASLNANNLLKVSLNDILATALTETSGQLTAGFKKFFNVATPTSTMNEITLVDTLTTYTGNTVQTGDAYAVVNDSSFGNAHLVRSTTPANTLSVDTSHRVPATVASGDDADAASIKTTIGTAGVGLTNIGDTRIAHLDADVSSRGTSTLTQTQVTGGAYSVQSASCVLGDARIAHLDADVSSRGTSTLTQAQVTGGAYTVQSALCVLGDARIAHLDADVSGRMATYTQPTGFLAATFPSGTVANTTNVTAGTITNVTNLTNAPTSGDLTATMKTSVQVAVAAQAATIAANVRDVSNGSPAAGSLGEAARNADAKAAVLIDTLGTPAGATIAADLAEIEAETDGIAAIPTNPYTGTPPTTTQIAAAVLDVAASSHNTAGSIGAAIGAASAPSAAVVAAAVWDLATSGHTTAGTFGAAMAAAGVAGDPLTAPLPGSYAAGTAGYTIYQTYVRLGSATVDIVSPFSPASGVLQLYKGSAYTGSRAITLAVPLATQDLTAIPSVELRWAGVTLASSSISGAGTSGQTVTFSASATVTAAWSAHDGPFYVWAVPADSSQVMLDLIGRVEVLDPTP